MGPANPFKTRQQLAVKNSLTGFVEPAHFDNFQFENQRRTFHSYGNVDRIIPLVVSFARHSEKPQDQFMTEYWTVASYRSSSTLRTYIYHTRLAARVQLFTYTHIGYAMDPTADKGSAPTAE